MNTPTISCYGAYIMENNRGPLVKKVKYARIKKQPTRKKKQGKSLSIHSPKCD